MILYHITTTYQLLNCIEHSLLSDSDKKVAILADFLTVKFPQYQDLLKFHFFDELYVVKYAKIKFVNEIDNNVINEVCSECIPYDITEFDEIYVAGIQMWFSTFLINNEISFVAFEEASGGLTRPEILEHNDERISQIRYEFMKNNNIYDYSNQFIKYVICNAKTQAFTSSVSYVDFDPVLNYSDLNQTDRENILEFFKCPQQVSTNGDETILLTQQLSNLGVVTFEEQILMYQLFVDYYCAGEKLVFKTHPDDQVYYKFLFDEAMVINDKFPSELLPFIFTKRPRKISTIYSTGIFTISHMFENKLELSMEFEKSYKDMYKYDIALRILEDYDCLSFESEGVDETALYTMWTGREISLNNNKKVSGNIIGTAINSFAEYSTKDVLICFDNSILLKENLDEIKGNNYNLHIISINTRSFRNTDVYIEDTDTNIYVVVKKDIDKGDFIMKGKRRLQNTGIDIEYKEVESKSFDYELLKGQLQATEERLKHYIDENKALKKQIEEGEI